MRKLLNILYITNSEYYLALERETVVVFEKKDKIAQFPLHTLEGIVTMSYKGASPELMGKCAERNINLAFYNPFGKFLCRVQGFTHGNVLLRKQQYRISDSKEASCLIARNMIMGKVFNSYWLIDRTTRDHPLRINVEKCNSAKQILKQNIAKAKVIDNLDTLRGIEGESASIFFNVFNELILNQKEDFLFKGRNKRPPLDNVNAMLSFGYTILANECANALEGNGLDSYVGFMHRDRSGRKSLSLDLMEELRPVLIDRFVLTLINNKIINKNDFEIFESGAVSLTDSGKKKFLKEWQTKKKEKITHPYLKEKIEWGLVPHVQSLLLARYIRGDIDGYPPFLWR